MATGYTRLRLLWGAFDYELAVQKSPGYSEAQMVTGGESAAIGSGVAVRRATLVMDRSVRNALLDPALMHFDFLNTTGGDPDDTWTNADYAAIETPLQTWMTALKNYYPAGHRFTQIIWHRVGSGVSKPNPAERVLTLATPIAGASFVPDLADQTAISITFKTGVRKSWGRTYFPTMAALAADGTIPTSVCDSFANATHTLVTAAASADMHHVVVSAPLNSSLNVEAIQVDNVPDVIRRRRIKRKTYAKVLP